MGRSGAGKSTFLHTCLRPYWTGAGGFLTQRLVDGSGETMGFRLVPVEGAAAPPPVTARYGPELPGIFIEKRPDGFHKYPEVFDGLGGKIVDRLFENPAAYRFCYLDEIGGVELKSALFLERLERLLGGGLPCIGVLKAPQNLAAMERRIALCGRTAEARGKLESRIREKPENRIVTYTGTKEQRLEISKWIERRLGSGPQESGRRGKRL